MLLAACGSGGTPAGDSGGGGGGGSGGGPGGPGGTGNPLAITLDFSVANDANVARTETVCASVPFPDGGYQPADLQNMVVSGHQTAWLPLQYWPDGRIKVAQAQFTDDFAANQTKQYVVARDEPSLTGSFTANGWVAQTSASLEFGAEVRDTFQVPYRAFASGAGTVLQETPLVRTKRWRTYHTAVGQTGIGRDYLSSTFYVTEFRDMPFAVVDWILGNDYLGADNVPAGNTNPNLRPLGTVDVRAARFLVKGVAGVLPYRPVEEGIEAAETLSGYTAFRVMQDTWLADAQTRRYRFLLRFEPASAPQAEKERWQRTATAMIEKPMYPLATRRAWAETGAAGLVGGPIEGPSDANARARADYASWADNSGLFGTWGSRGDAKVTATTGTPRNHPLTPEFARAVQGQCHMLVQKLEQMAWAQAMRPYHLWNLYVGAEQQILLWDGTPMLNVPGESLGRRALLQNNPYGAYRTIGIGQHRGHGWEHFDHELWTCDLLFDYWTLSGDAWAKEELRQLGQSLKGLMRLTYYYTAGIQAARAEGWCMQGFAQVYQATQDASIKHYAMRRAAEIVDVQRRKTHPSRAMTFQGNYPNTGYPNNHQFFMPWQHGAVLYGYLGAYRSFDEPLLLEIAEDVVDTVEYSWVTNLANHPHFGFVAQGLRYYVPATHNGASVPANYWDGLPSGVHLGDSPLGGVHTFLIGGLHILADLTSDISVRTRALQYGGMLRGTVSAGDRWNKWYAVLPENYVP